jgi:hypothetical protein
MERFNLRFDGGLASTGRLHYYEYTRSQYATARFLTTIEHFRRTGEVAQKVSSRTYVDILVEAPERGSFVESLQVAVAEGVATAVSAQLQSLISLVWDTLVPRRKKTDSDIVELARIRLAEEQARGQANAAQMDALKQIILDQNATTRQALDLVRASIGSSNLALGRADLTQRRLGEMQSELTDEQSRTEAISKDRTALERIPGEKLARLTSRLRPMIPEMAKPLSKSADSIGIEASDGEHRLVVLTRENVQEIAEKDLEETPTEIVVRVKSYDRDRGVGKVSSETFDRQLNFSVAPSNQDRLLFKILDAMTRDQVTFLCRRFVDRSGFPTSLLLEDIV